MKSSIFPSIYSRLTKQLENHIVVHHMPFDRTAIARACDKYRLPSLNAKWLDSAKVARRTWSEYAERGYSLDNIAKKLNINFHHHDALEDAIVAGEIVSKAIMETGISIEDWLIKTQKPIHQSLSNSGKIKLEGNPEGPLFGETIVFTGELGITRKEAAQIAANAGCNVIDALTRNVTILVVGQQDLRKVGEKGKSSKQIKAEQYKKQGNQIVIIGEDDFKRMAADI